MAQDISLSGLRRLRDQKVMERARIIGGLDSEINKLNGLIAALESFAKRQREPARKGGRRTLRRRRTPGSREAQPQLPLPTNGRPSIWEAVSEVIKKEPGIETADAVKRLIGRTASEAKDQEKLLSTRIGQFVKKGRLRREGRKLFLPERAA
jgi:hypothetical protein